VLHNEASVYDFELNDDMSGTRRDLGQARELHLLHTTYHAPHHLPRTTTHHAPPRTTHHHAPLTPYHLALAAYPYQAMELLLYGRIGHYEKCVNRIRQHSARSAEEEMAARLLQKLTRGRRGRAESSALASSALAFAATLGAATSMQAAFRGYSFRKTGAGARPEGDAQKDASGRPLSAVAARKKTYEQSGLKERVEMEERQERQAERVAFEARNQYKMQSDPSEMEISPPPQGRGARASEGDGGGGSGGGGVHAAPGAARAGSSSRPASGKDGPRPRSGSSGRGQEQAQRDALASLGRGQARPTSGKGGKGQGQGRPSSGAARPSSGAAQRRPSGAGAGPGRSSGRRRPSSDSIGMAEAMEEEEEMDPEAKATETLQKCAA
tara:strand:- start:47 stop:1192 length:1146 start_codon:yes stop_codon:yes gene_type:complete